MSASSGIQPTPSEPNDRSAVRGRTDDDEAHQWAHWLRRTATDSAEVWDDDHDTARAEADGATHLLDLVAAVEYLTRGHRAGFTVWDALEEALRWWANEQELVHNSAPDPGAPTDDEPVTGPDPLGHTLRRFANLLDDHPDARPASVALEQALRHWTTRMANRHNDGHHWPHPSPRRSFPPNYLMTHSKG